MSNLSVRILNEQDRPEAERFLQGRLSESMFLLSNMRAVGLVDQGRVYQGTYFGAFDPRGELRGVVCQSWHGAALLQAPEGMEVLLDALAVQAPRELAGFIGPWPQIEQAKRYLKLDQATYRLNKRELLYALPLDKLTLPAKLTCGELLVRRATAEDLELVSRWSVGFEREALGRQDEDDETLYQQAHQSNQRSIQDGSLFVSCDAKGALRAMSAFNALLPEAVQIGGVWTPPELRAQGLARATVAGQLALAKEEGKQLATLFTAEDNIAAQRAYEAIGFKVVGTYGLSFLKEPWTSPTSTKVG